ncbi:MAG: DUF2007 domain-containing protein [Candidatus Omnitrophica bacterium]|nr:DUF2007 domain-containing protein [Candidatus Omnitrophota bacterium]
MELVAVYTSHRINEVHFMQSLLESYGIKAVVFNDTLAAIAPHHVFGQGGARLMVRDDDRTEALKIVRQYEEGKRVSDN